MNIRLQFRLSPEARLFRTLLVSAFRLRVFLSQPCPTPKRLILIPSIFIPKSQGLVLKGSGTIFLPELHPRFCLQGFPPRVSSDLWWAGAGGFQTLAGRVGSVNEALEVLRVGSGRVGSP